MTKHVIIGWLVSMLAFSANADEKLTELVDAKIAQKSSEISLQLKFSAPTAVEYTSKSLPASSGVLPRYFIDITPLKLPRNFQTPSIDPASTVKKIRFAQHDKNTVRVVFEVSTPDVASNFKVERYAEGLSIANTPTEIRVAHQDEEPVISWSKDSIETKPMDAKVTEAKQSEETVPVINTSKEMREAVNSVTLKTPDKVVVTVPAKEEPKSVPSDSKIRKIRIIVDPGHGGDDSGARGKKGTFEKNVTLDVALRVRTILEKNPNYDVFMTRDKDTTLQLLDRTKFANRMNGDLFVSIHANASPKRTSHGVSTYFLNNADDQESLRVAMRENGELDPVMLGQTSKNSDDYYLEVMKASMVKNFHTTQSTDLAKAVQLDLLKTLRKDYSDVTDLGVRSARFYVLTGATMPAILVETSFISNPEEEKRLSDSRYQETLANAVVHGVDMFLKSRPEFENGHAVFLSEGAAKKSARN